MHLINRQTSAGVVVGRRGGDMARRAGLVAVLGLTALGGLATSAGAMPARDAPAPGPGSGTTIPVALSAYGTGPAGVHITPLSQATLPARIRVHDDGIDIRTRGRTTMLATAITVDPGGTFGWHTHPGPVLVSVGQGTLTLVEPHGASCRQTTVSAGHGFIEGGGDVHLARNDGAEPIKLNATFLARPGTTEFLTTVSAPPGCGA